MSRRLAREAAMCLLYEEEIVGEANNETLIEMKDVFQTEKILEKHGDYIKTVRSLFDEKKGDIDAAIAKYSRAWKMDRLSKVDLSILRLAIIELLYFDDIPYKVTVNEAVEMAKKYSAEKSPKFINGLLGSVIEEMSAEAKNEEEKEAQI